MTSNNEHRISKLATHWLYKLRDYAQLSTSRSHHVWETETSLYRLIAFAEANGMWRVSYERLDTGRLRLTLGNRIRAKLRNNPDWHPIFPKLPE